MIQSLESGQGQCGDGPMEVDQHDAPADGSAGIEVSID